MRLLFTLRFDGSRYHGWQVQPNGITVQQVMQDAAQRILGVRPGITGCSRTDAGVHANMFCCTMDTDKTMPPDKWVAALNAHLPEDVAVYACQPVPDDFHPRYRAVAKQYVYKIWNHSARNPFLKGYALHYRFPLEVERLNRAAADFLGTHDFTAFCAAGSSVEDRVRTVRLAEVSRPEEDLVLFTVEADGFLYNMVRIMVGTLLEMAQGLRPYDDIPAILASRDRERAGFTAPACGLYLNKVYY